MVSQTSVSPVSIAEHLHAFRAACSSRRALLVAQGSAEAWTRTQLRHMPARCAVPTAGVKAPSMHDRPGSSCTGCWLGAHKVGAPGSAAAKCESCAKAFTRECW